MIPVMFDAWSTWMHAFLWPLFRLLGLASTAPLLGESAIPKRVKVGLAAVMAAALAPALAPLPDVPAASWQGLWIAAQQVFIGIAMGLTMRIVFAAVQAAGELTGLQMGLSFASFFDPSSGGNTAVLARLFNVVAMLLFLAVNGHLLMLQGLLHSFEVLPIGAPLYADGWGVLLEFSGRILGAGLLLALPLIVMLLAINLALGILNRTAQQLSVFAVGFPISLSVGLLLLSVVLPQTSEFLQRQFQQGGLAMERLVWSLAGG